MNRSQRLAARHARTVGRIAAIRGQMRRSRCHVERLVLAERIVKLEMGYGGTLWPNAFGWRGVTLWRRIESVA